MRSGTINENEDKKRPDFPGKEKSGRKPRVLWHAVLRLLLISAITLIFFGFICRPGIINGSSMEPSYPSTGLLFFSPLLLKITPLERGDVVTIRYGSQRVMLLKRVVAFAGEQVEFRHGVCYVNGTAMTEDYVKNPCTWNLPPKIVKEGCIYVVGDNRAMPWEEHVSGQVKTDLLQGKALW